MDSIILYWTYQTDRSHKLYHTELMTLDVMSSLGLSVVDQLSSSKNFFFLQVSLPVDDIYIYIYVCVCLCEFDILVFSLLSI